MLQSYRDLPCIFLFIHSSYMHGSPLSLSQSPSVLSSKFPPFRLISLGSSSASSERAAAKNHQPAREGERASTLSVRPLTCLVLSPPPSLPSRASVNKLLSVLLCNNLISPATCSKIHLLAITVCSHGFGTKNRLCN